MRVSKYTKTNLCHILLFGEKPHLHEKYQHNKFIFFAVQRFLSQTKRCYFIEENKPPKLILADPHDDGDNDHD